MVSLIVADVEGTTTDIRFVKDGLFPLARARVAAYATVNPTSAEVVRAREAVATSLGIDVESLSLERFIETLHRWMDDDLKIGALKTLQGRVWRSEYESGRLRGHVYPDVPLALARWTAARVRVAVFSSGSVEAQQLLFRHSEAGDLTGHLSGYFDTTTGPKGVSRSYESIVATYGLATSEALFLSDSLAELDAAAEAGLRTGQLARDPGVASGAHPVFLDFDAVDALVFPGSS